MDTKKNAVKAKKPLSEAGFGAAKNIGILDHIEKIVEISQEKGIDGCLSAGKASLKYITAKLGISPMQAILFSHFMERSESSCILISEIAKAIKCSNIKILKYISECEDLEKKKLVRCSKRNNNVSYRVPYEVMDSLRKNNTFSPEKLENLSIYRFFAVLERLFQEREEGELTRETLFMELMDLIDMNLHLNFCRKIKSYGFYADDFVLLACFCHLSGNNDDDNIRENDIGFLYDDKGYAKSVRKSLSSGDHTLVAEKFVAYANSNGFLDTETWKMSDTAKKELLSELNIKESQHFKKNLIQYDSVKSKTMFYNGR